MVVLLSPASPPLCPPPSRIKTETCEQEFAAADSIQHVHVPTNVEVTVVYKSQISELKAPANLDGTAICDFDCLGSVSKF